MMIFKQNPNPQRASLRRAAAVLTALLAVFTATAPACAAECGDTAVSIVNFYPGSDIYELEGHTVLRITSPLGDDAVSYGTYNFEQPNFVYRFVKGETDYWVTVVPWRHMAAPYLKDGRRIVEHRIDMSSEQKKKLFDLVRDNLREENRTYRYNYVRDNCATRPLRMIELALGDSIILGEAGPGAVGDVTFRDIMRHYHRNYPWYQFGIDLALGSGIDQSLDNREKAFAPAVLDYQLADATAGGRKLVSGSEVLNDVSPDNAVLAPTPWYMTPMAAGIALLIVVALVTWRDMRRRRVSRWLDCALYALFGSAGLLITFLVFISVHEATSPNILLLWLNPLCFIPCIFIWINRCKLIVFSYQIVNFVALITLACLWAAGIQTLNIAFIPLLLCDAIRSANYIYLTYRNKCHD